jgi:hypothetical protein
VTRGRPAVRRIHRPTVAAIGALCAALAVGVLPGAPAEAAPTPLAGTARIDPVAAEAQCRIGPGYGVTHTIQKARTLMAGRAELGDFGWFHLAKNPNWRPVSTLDSSGNGHMHSLHYLLPLLRAGVRTGNTAMIDRFYFLLHDWFRDNKPGGPTSRLAWGPPIYEGFRSIVLLCAAAGPRGNSPWVLKALQQNGAMAARSDRYEGVNNASLHQQMGLYAIAVAIGRPAWRKIAIARMRALAVKLVHVDGSDEEGALSYARNNYQWFGQAAERMRRAGDPVPVELTRVGATPAFLAHATRPDGRIEALGDSSPQLLGDRNWTGTAAEWSATGGASGVAPTDTMTAYAGGYVFGRSGWGSAERPLVDETYYSVRAGQGNGIPHAHDDSGSLTLYSRGAPLLLDTGQWEYRYGATRSFVVSRAAHNVVIVDGVRRTRPRPELRTARVDGLDITTVVDRGYSGVTLTRTIAYDRVEDVMVVWDRLSSAKPVRASQQWGLGRGRSVSMDGDAIHTSGPGANISMLFTSGGAPQDLALGKKSPMRGWNSQAYGELAPTPSVRATQRGTSLSWLTVLAPRADGVPASSVSATATVGAANASVALTTPAGSATVNLDDVSGSRTAPTTMTPAAVPAQPIVLAGTTSRVRALGLAPSAPVTLESSPTGAGTWTPVASSTASAAGTVSIPVTVAATTDYRVVSGVAASTPSAPVTVVGAVAPQPPVSVVATATGPGKVTVTWEPPVDTGGAPLTRFAIRIGDKRVVVPADARSAVISRVTAGNRVATVRAFNQVAMSGWAPAAVAVPAYPSVTGPGKARKGTRVTLHLAGLLPHQSATLRVTTVASGKATTRKIDPKADGTATVRLLVRRTVRVVAISGGVSSPVHRIKVP